MWDGWNNWVAETFLGGQEIAKLDSVRETVFFVLDSNLDLNIFRP